MMVGIFKTNEIETIGGTVPQGDGIELAGDIKGWQVVEVPDDMISSVQEFDIQPVDESIIADMNGPQQEGAYNAPAYEIENVGDKLTFEMNPGQEAHGIEGVEDGTKMTSPDEMDDRAQKNYNSEEVKPYKAAYQKIKKISAKSVLRDDIRGNVVDLEDDLADTKAAAQIALYYLTNEWNLRSVESKNKNTQMTRLSDKVLDNTLKMTSDLNNAVDKMTKIIEKESTINALVNKKYKYNSSRGE